MLFASIAPHRRSVKALCLTPLKVEMQAFIFRSLIWIRVNVWSDFFFDFF
jgi:hypothetical protein